MRVDFMIIGAQKCGTTTLSEILRNHPQIVGCREKEPHFFSKTTDWRKEIEEYHALFEPQTSVLYFEASTTYTFYPYRNLKIWDDIYDYNPNMKLIYIVRNPADRIISSYMHAFERGFTELPFDEAIVKDRFHIDITRYYTQIDPYIRKFGADKVLILDFDELINNREKILHQIADFLSIDATVFEGLGRVHANKSLAGNKTHIKYDSPGLFLKAVRKFFPSLWGKISDNSARNFMKKPKLTTGQRDLIATSLRLEIRELEKLMGKDLSHWLYEKPVEVDTESKKSVGELR